MAGPDLSAWLNTVTCGDCLEVLRELPDCSVESVITDPPYELGFMGKSWDAQGISFRTEVWAECLRVAKPGATLLAFGGTRTYHRIAVAIEDAGWYIADSIHWVYGTGFPKSLNIGKAIDKAAGAEREVVGERKSPFRMADPHIGNALMSTVTGDTRQVDDEGYIRRTETAPATDLAREWEGWGTALKPAHEPVIVARKPCEGSFAANAEKWGVAGLNVDGCRVGTQDNLNGGAYSGGERPTQFLNGGLYRKQPNDFAPPAGRWPPNTVFSHSPGCRCVGEERVETTGVWGAKQNTQCGSGGTMGDGWAGRPSNDPGVAAPDGTETVAKWECVDGCPVKLLAEQSGESGGGTFKLNSDTAREAISTRAHNTRQPNRTGSVCNHADRGTAARFFPQFEAEPFSYTAKAARAEREDGLRGVIPCVKCGGLDSETHLNADGDPVKCLRNSHSTVKPVELMSWLCRLTKTPCGGIVLDPFGGSGTTAVAAVQEGREFIIIEQSPEYCDIARARIADAQAEQAARLPLEVE